MFYFVFVCLCKNCASTSGITGILFENSDEFLHFFFCVLHLSSQFEYIHVFIVSGLALKHLAGREEEREREKEKKSYKNSLPFHFMHNFNCNSWIATISGRIYHFAWRGFCLYGGGGGAYCGGQNFVFCCGCAIEYFSFWFVVCIRRRPSPSLSTFCPRSFLCTSFSCVFVRSLVAIHLWHIWSVRQRVSAFGIDFVKIRGYYLNLTEFSCAYNNAYEHQITWSGFSVHFGKWHNWIVNSVVKEL